MPMISVTIRQSPHQNPSHPSIPLLLLFFLLLLLTHESKPIPKCASNSYYKIHPLIPNESAILNLDTVFTGYNLTFELDRQKEWSKYITMNEKLRMQRKQQPQTPLIGLKSYHLERVGNSWGTSFVALMERGDRTYLSYGYLSANTSAPVINKQVRVENSSSTVCFDAAIFPKQDIIIVDCATKLQAPTPQGFLYKNYFYYFHISDGSAQPKVQNQLFIPFTSLTRRKLQLYTERMSGNTYLLRAYMFDGVDQVNQNNTYVDIFMVNEPRKPWVVAVVDRSFLKMSVLRVSDIRVYLSEIYVLDYTKGLHRIRINTEEDLVYNGFYEAKGFTRFAVYSNNLDDRFQLALANSHQVYEIDWTKLAQPILLTKYSLMPDSTVKQVFINQNFIVVLSQTPYPSPSQPDTTYNYTWVLTRGDRTYTKAFQTIKHNNFNVFIQFNAQDGYLMVFDEDKIVNYAIDVAILVLTLKRDQDFIDRLMNFTILGVSTQAGVTTRCSFIFNFTLVQENNRTMWAVGDAPAPYFHANYPGKVVIPIHQYALGPNITYKITQVKKGQLRKNKIYQQDQLSIHWQKPLPLQNITFLRTQTINSQQQDLLLLYTQNSQFVAGVSSCTPTHQHLDVTCTNIYTKQLQGILNNWATTLFFSRYTLRNHHIVAYTTTKHFNKVIVDDVSVNENVIELEMGKGFAGNVTNVQTYGRYLFVILRYYKSIRVYDLEDVVQGNDDYICDINYLMMYKLGVKYFSPQSVETSQFYPNILFIKTSDTIIILDLNRQCVPKLLSTLHPVQSSLIQFSFTLTLSHLIVTSPPSTILQYDLSRIYLKDVKLVKKYPTYGFKFPKNYDTDVSEYGNCMFITMVSQGGDYEVFVYKAGLPAVAVLYDIVDLYVFGNILLDASGLLIDYITVYSNGQLRIFRQYQTPMAQIYNSDRDYQFYIQYYNVATTVRLQLISVTILNLPTRISLNPKLLNIMETKDLLYSGTDMISQINDTDWYDGNVLTIKSECRDCQNGVVVKNHIHYQTAYALVPGLIDYDWTYQGGSFQLFDSLLSIDPNGNPRQYIHFPQYNHSICLFTSTPINGGLQASACWQGQGINLYLTSHISHKAFTLPPYSSKAKQVTKIQIVNQLLLLVDSSRNPFFKSRPGGVVIYAINYDMDQDEAFEEIQYIDYTDFVDTDQELYVANAQMEYNAVTKTYMLYITQITKGIYTICFKFNSYLKGLTILSTNYINMPLILSKQNMTAPYDSTYQAIKIVQSYYDSSLLQTKHTLIMTTGTYYTMMIQVRYGSSWGIIGQARIVKMFLRYAYYVVENQVKSVNGLLLLKQTLPQEYEDLKDLKSKQLITVYDLRAMPIYTAPNKIPQLGLIGAHAINSRIPITYDFNLTRNKSDPHSQLRINLALIHEFSNTIQQLSLHRNLSVYTKQVVDTQIIYLDLINDFDMKKIRILLNGLSPYPQWKLVMIILFSIVGFFLFCGLVFVGFKKFKAYRAQYNPDEPEQRTSLITQEKTDRNSAVDNRYSYTEPKKEQPKKDTRYQDTTSKYTAKQDNRYTAKQDNKYTAKQDNKYGSTSRYGSSSSKYDSGSKYESSKQQNKYDKYDKYDRYDAGETNRAGGYKYDKYSRFDYDKSSKNKDEDISYS